MSEIRAKNNRIPDYNVNFFPGFYTRGFIIDAKQTQSLCVWLVEFVSATKERWR